MTLWLKASLLLAAAVAVGLALSTVLLWPAEAGHIWRLLPGLLLVAVAAALTQRRLAVSADRLRAAVAQLSRGKFPDQIAVASTERLGPLARSLEKASSRLQEQVAALEAERRHVQTILNSMSEAVLAVDARLRITSINPVFRRMFDVGLDPIGRHPLEVIRNVELSRGIETALADGQVQQAEIEVGQSVVLARFAPYRSRETVDGVVVVLSDISELRRLEGARRDFVSNVSHELKTPLTSIQGYAETLLDEEGLSATHQRFIERIDRNARELSALIDELLNLAQLEREQTPLDVSTVQLEDLLASVQRDYQQRLEKKGLSWHIENRSGVDSVRGGRVVLQRVFNNLVENAIHYTENGGVAITIDRSNGELLFAVRDTGVGIPEQDLPRVFERFYRVGKDRSRLTGGSGIGLAIVKHIVALHGGRVWIESEQGKGTTVFFTIPERER